jgi:hypothetical protein
MPCGAGANRTAYVSQGLPVRDLWMLYPGCAVVDNYRCQYLCVRTKRRACVGAFHICARSDAQVKRSTVQLDAAMLLLRRSHGLGFAADCILLAVLVRMLIAGVFLCPHFSLSSLVLFQVRRPLQFFPTLNPHPPQLLFNLALPLLPHLHLGQPLAQLRQLLFDARLLARSADALKLPFRVRIDAQRERVRVVFLEAGAGRYCDERFSKVSQGEGGVVLGKGNVLMPLALHASYNTPSTSLLTALVPSSTNA